MSLDSRFFGAVPEANIQGTPVLLFWPFGDRWGIPSQPTIPPSIYTVAFFALTIAGSILYVSRQRRKSELELNELRKKEDV